ncbi:RNA-guided endonuclease InsQ/TnpB family protein [Actinopolyspora halophila]|uniref:RNA-guided endonuclease InsQ/TnpB family protein n=1 Tax=Actinopolyspora halophila TaxID=1850 RepID=UPI000376B9F6|nr:RNA-guided endonuclease TnpB family protein [Actinopolyspora halophila]
MSRKQRGSINRAKARRRLARQHVKVADTRADWLHKETTRLVRENQAIILEDLAVSGLARTRLAKSVHDASWRTFRRLLTEKAARYGRELVVLDRWLPTNQTCSACGSVDWPKPLLVRTWSCPRGAVHDRDRNADRNILVAGRVKRQNACGPDVRPHTGADGDEAGSSATPRGDTAPHAAWAARRIPTAHDGEHVKRLRRDHEEGSPAGPPSSVSASPAQRSTCCPSRPVSRRADATDSPAPVAG